MTATKPGMLRKSQNAAILTALATAALFSVLMFSCGGGGGSSTPPPSQAVVVSISPSTASLTVDGTQQFTATVSNTTNTAVNWSVNNTAGGNTTLGTISSTGLYTAPDLVPSSNSVTVTATSQADTTKSASATVSLAYPMPTLSSVSPTYVTVDSPATTLTLTGTGFTKASAVSFNSSALTTSYISSTQLTAMLPAADEGTEGQFNLAVANPSPGGGASSAMQLNVVGGALTVKIIDLPSGTPGNVTVTGPNGLNLVLTSSQTITGAEGTYNVTAKGVAVGSSTYYATNPTQTATFAAGNSATLTVDYYDIIPNTTKVLDQAGMQGLVVSTDGTTLTIPGSSAVAQSLQPDDVLISPPTAAAPYGLLVKILTVSQGASVVTATVANASLEDAFQQISVDVSLPFAAASTASNRQSAARNTRSRRLHVMSLSDSCASQPVKYSYDFNLPITGDQDGNYITPSKLDGSVEICPTFVFKLQMGLFKIQSLTMAIQTGEHVDVNSEMGELVGVNMEYDYPIPPAPEILLPTFAIPGTPIWITPRLVFFANATGNVQAAVSSGLEQDATVELGASYANGAWTPIAQHTSKFQGDPPSLDGGLTLKGALGARIDFLVYDTAGPSIGLDVYSQFKADITQDPWWTWTAGIEGPIAFHVTVFGYKISDYDLGDVFNFSWLMRQASGGFLPSDAAPVLSSVSPNSAQVGNAVTTLSLVGSNFVPDSVVGFSGLPLSTTFVDSSDLTATLPQGVLVLDGVFPVTVTNPDTSGAISSPANFTVTGALVSVSPTSAQVPARELQQFDATVLGPSNNTVTWSVNGATGGNSTVGSINTSGLYTAPASPPNPATVTVTATSQAMPSVSGSASVTIGPYAEKPVYSFTSLTDGAAPSVPLIQAQDGYYYGTTQQGGTYGYGTTFRVDSTGNVTPLYEFSGSYGEYLQSPLVQASDGYFYGTAFAGGDLSCAAIDGFTGCGTVFKMDSSGVVTILHMFEGATEGAGPGGKLTIGTDGYFYGITNFGGASGYGTVFQMDSSGKVNTLYSFSGSSDGLSPEGGLIQATDGYFYGTTGGGGDPSCQIWLGYQGCGTVFRIDSAEHFTTLYTFEGGTDGANPTEDLLQASDGYLYGTTLFGGDASCSVSGYTGCGTIFKIDTAGHFALVHDFSGGSEGGVPFSALIQACDGDFYGTATAGGNPSCSVTASNEAYPTYIGCGTVFKMDSAGNVNALYSFSGSPNDGSNPFAALIEGSDGYLYGTTRWGGADSSCPYTDNGGCGTVFKVSGPGGPLPQQQRTETKRSVSRWLNPKPLTPTSRPVTRTQSGQVTPRVQSLRGLKQPPKVR